MQLESPRVWFVSLCVINDLHDVASSHPFFAGFVNWVCFTHASEHLVENSLLSLRITISLLWWGTRRCSRWRCSWWRPLSVGLWSLDPITNHFNILCWSSSNLVIGVSTLIFLIFIEFQVSVFVACQLFLRWNSFVRSDRRFRPSWLSSRRSLWLSRFQLQFWHNPHFLEWTIFFDNLNRRSPLEIVLHCRENCLLPRSCARIICVL